jgi:transcriptional regulator GlxA family with amidase domain
VEIYKRLYIAKEWMEANYHQPITLNDIADEALLNSQHFLRLFSQLFKKTPHQFLIDLRLERAGNLLATTNASVSDICLSVGWESLASFSKLFKQKQGLTPTAFRNMAQN